MMLHIPFRLKNICCVDWSKHFSGAAACPTKSQNKDGGTHTNARKKKVVIDNATTKARRNQTANLVNLR